MENNAPQKKQLPAFLILTIISVVAAVVLAFTNMVTAGPIAEHAMAALKEAFSAVMPAEGYEEMTVPAEYGVSSLYAAKNGDEIIGYCVTASGTGYGGPVAVTLGVDLDGVVTGCAVGDTSFAETAGFGMRAKEPAFQDQFPGISAVEGGAFEALSGATVTSEAVRAATNKGLKCVAEVVLGKTQNAEVVFGAPAGGSKEEAPAPAPLTGAVQEGTAKGFQSDVTVQLTMEGGVISSLSIASGSETPGFGTRCAEDEAFINQFIGQAGPFTLGENVDALSGATVTSTAVVEAVNAALSAPAAAAGESYTGTAKGFQSDVTVTVTVENGAIASMMIDSAGETAGFGTRCAEDAAFLAQFVGKAAPLTLGENIDALAGATVTSTAVVEAANAALANVGAAAETVTILTEGENANLGVNTSGAAVVAPAEGYTGDVTVKVNVEDGKVTSGEFVVPAPAGEEVSGTAKGFQSDVTVTLTVDNGVITSIKVDSANETPGFGTRCGEDAAFLNQFVGKNFTPDVGEGIEALSGATVTSTAVIEAINNAMGVETAVEEVTADTATSATASADATTSATAAVEETAPAGETFTGTAKGFQSDVTVTLTVDQGVITSIKVDSANETPGFGTRCGENEAFLNQFVGQTAPVTADVLSGATVTSNAVIEAVNASSAVAASAEAVPAPVDDVIGVAQGFQSEVNVAITLNEDGAIAALSIGAAEETPGFGTRCAEDEAFIAQFIGKTAPFAIGGNVDALSGATVTSTAVVEAINTALAAGVAVEESCTAEAPAAPYLTASAQGFQSEVTVNVVVDEAGKIIGLSVNAAGETAGFGTRCGEDDAYLKQFLGQSAPVAVDALSGATVTSTAVAEAVNAALAK